MSLEVSDVFFLSSQNLLDQSNFRINSLKNNKKRHHNSTYSCILKLLRDVHHSVVCCLISMSLYNFQITLLLILRFVVLWSDGIHGVISIFCICCYLFCVLILALLQRNIYGLLTTCIFLVFGLSILQIPIRFT